MRLLRSKLLQPGIEKHSLHCFPQKQFLRRLWKAKCKVDKPIKRWRKFCSQHFLDDDFISGHKSRRGMLTSNAVPSQNLPQQPKQKVLSTSAQLRENRMEARKLLSVLPAATKSQSPPEDVHDTQEIRHLQDENVHLQNMTTMDQVEPQHHEILVAKVIRDSSVQVNTLDDLLSLKVSVIPIILKCDRNLCSWTGISTFKVLETIQKCVERVYFKVHAVAPPVSSTHRMSMEDKVILCLMKMKTNLSIECISHLFQISSTACSRVLTTVIPLIRIAVQCVIYFPSVVEIRSNLPICFKPDFAAVRAILDCTEIHIQIPRCINCKISTFSGYKSANTTKYLICVTPAGLISFISSGYSGKSSEKFVVNSEKLLDNFESGDAIMVDKGFLIQEECRARGITLVRPSFFQSPQNQFEGEEVVSNTKVAAARVHVERVIGRMKAFAIMTDKVEYNVLPQIDDIVYIIGAIVNLSRPILDINKF